MSEFGFSIAEQIIFKMSGEQAAEIEKLIKQNFPCFAQEVKGFKTEATFSHFYEDVVKFVEEKVLEYSFSKIPDSLLNFTTSPV